MFRAEVGLDGMGWDGYLGGGNGSGSGSGSGCGCGCGSGSETIEINR